MMYSSSRIWLVLVLFALCSSWAGFRPATAENLESIKKQIAGCAEITSTLKRSECYDALAKKLGLQPKSERTEPAGEWDKRVDRSEFDDTKSVYLTLLADKPVAVGRYNVVTPELWVRCHENTTAFYIIFEEFLGSRGIKVEYRIDRQTTRETRWLISSNSTAAGLWNGSGSIPFIRKLFGAERLLIRVTPYNESPVTVSFAIGGLRTAVAELAEACNWRP